ncbi:MAG TPA: pseudouridine synthase [Thermoanaerobaculia bacterium]|jgi:23S rRNA pseudouridine2605 synthase
MSEERVQKLLARAGIASRRKAEELIREARVTINGRAAELGDKADLERDAVKVDGKRLQPHTGAHRYLLLNKPKYVVSTLADPQGRTTVIDLVPPRLRRALAPVGRLDYATEGLLLLTDDGDFALQVAHPRYGCVKTYEAKVKGQPTAAELDRLRAGIVLDGKRTAPCRITARATPRRALESENSWWKVELGEGRSRQIREMFQRVGHPVQKLRRVAIGPLSDPDLPLGMVRELTEREVEMLRGAAARSVRKSARSIRSPKSAGASSPKPARSPRSETRPARPGAGPARKPAAAASRAGRSRGRGPRG